MCFDEVEEGRSRCLGKEMEWMFVSEGGKKGGGEKLWLNLWKMSAGCGV